MDRQGPGCRAEALCQREVKRRLDSPTQDVAQTKELHGVSDYEQDRVEYFLLYTIS